MKRNPQEEVIVHFYLCSLRNNFDDFDFDDAFDHFSYAIQSTLREHGICTFDEFLEHQQEFHWGHDDGILDRYTMMTDYIHFTPKDVFEAIVKGQHEACQRAFGSMFDDLQEIYDKLNNLPTEIPELIQLFDEVIHAQHATGAIFDDIDTEALKSEAEEMWQCEQEDAA